MTDLKHTNKLHAGSSFPVFDVSLYEGDKVTLGKPGANADWQMIVVYRGKHCPMCTKFLNHLNEYKNKLDDLGVELFAITADSKEQVGEHLKDLKVNFPLGYGLELEQMKQLGLYISEPRSEKETDHLFPEPGLFVVNGEGKLHIVDLSNNPFSRPDLKTLVDGIKFLKDPENNYPIRGIHN